MQTAAIKHHPGKAVIDAAITRIGKQLAIRDAAEFIETMLSAKSDWLDTSEDIHDVVSFYKTQLPTWRKLLDALSGFADNRDVLLKLPAVATALADLESIRDNPTPYGQIPRVETLIKTVEAANETAAQQRRERALNSIDAKIGEVMKSLDQVQAAAALRNKALQPLQELKTKVAALSSIPKILYFQDQGGNLLDDAMLIIESASQKRATVLEDSGGATTENSVDDRRQQRQRRNPPGSFGPQSFHRRSIWKPKPRSKATSPNSSPNFSPLSRPANAHASNKKNP
jgi:hypothetical protein